MSQVGAMRLWTGTVTTNLPTPKELYWVNTPYLTLHTGDVKLYNRFTPSPPDENTETLLKLPSLLIFFNIENRWKGELHINYFTDCVTWGHVTQRWPGSKRSHGPPPLPGSMIFTESPVQVPVLALLDNRPLMIRERGNIKPNYPNVANSLMALEFCNRSFTMNGWSWIICIELIRPRPTPLIL